MWPYEEPLHTVVGKGALGFGGVKSPMSARRSLLFLCLYLIMPSEILLFTIL